MKYVSTSFLSGSETLTDLNPDIQAINDKLKSHIAKHYSQVHGNLTVAEGVTLDKPSQHVIGRKLIAIKIGGQTYKLPADTSKTGPPQPPRITVVRPVDLFIYTKVDFKDVDVSAEFVCNVAGTAPIFYRWQVQKGSNWYDLTMDGNGTGNGFGNGLAFEFEGGNKPTLFIFKAVPGVSEEQFANNGNVPVVSELFDFMGFNLFGGDDVTSECKLRLTAWNEGNSISNRSASPAFTYKHKMRGEEGLF